MLCACLSVQTCVNPQPLLRPPPLSWAMGSLFLLRFPGGPLPWPLSVLSQPRRRRGPPLFFGLILFRPASIPSSCSDLALPPLPYVLSPGVSSMPQQGSPARDNTLVCGPGPNPDLCGPPPHVHLGASETLPTQGFQRVDSSPPPTPPQLSMPGILWRSLLQVWCRFLPDGAGCKPRAFWPLPLRQCPSSAHRWFRTSVKGILTLPPHSHRSRPSSRPLPFRLLEQLMTDLTVREGPHSYP